MFDSLRKLRQRYSSGKQFGEKYQRARAVIQLALFQKLRDRRKVNAISSFLFSEEPPKEIDYPNLERDAFAALDEDPELEELVWETLVVKLGLCRAYDNRDLFERILEGPVFKNMGGKRPVRDVAHYARLIDRIYARFSGKQGGAESKGNQGQRGFSRRLAGKMDEYTIAILLGRVREKRVFELETQGLSRDEAERLANEQISESIRAANVDIESYKDVRRWARTFRP